MTVNKVLLAFFFCISGLVWSVACCAIDHLRVSVNKEQVALGQTLELVVTANGVAEESALETSALSTDFEIVEVVFDKYSYLVNLQLSNTSSWIIRLKPKTSGTLVIPALEVESAISESISVLAIDLEQGDSATSSNEFRIQTSLRPATAIAGQDILYTVTVYNELEVVRPRIYQSFPDELQASQIGEDEKVEEYRAGQQVSFLRRHYLIRSPQPGLFELPKPIFTGIARERNRGSFGRIFSTEKEVSVAGDINTLVIRDTPDINKQSTLVANNVVIEASWQTSKFQVGDANVLTLVIQAEGVAVDRLPEIEFTGPDTFRVYPEPSSRLVKIVDESLVSTLTQSFALVPTHAGEIALPELSVPWFNALLQSEQVARFQSRTVNVQDVFLSDPVMRTDSSWYTDYRVYLSLSIIILIVYIIHWRWLLHRIRNQGVLAQETDSTDTDELTTVIKHRNERALEKALKSWLDVRFGAQPSLSHYKRLPILQLNAPDIADLITEFYSCHYGDVNLSQDYFSRLHASTQRCDEKMVSEQSYPGAEGAKTYPYSYSRPVQ